jgi:predicted enzyme related to lactoylglutathione lyase
MELGTIYLEVGGREQVEVLRDFYRDRLGLAVRSEESGESVWLDAGPVTLGFHSSSEIESDPGLVNLSFNVADVDAEAKRLKAEGVAIAQEPADVPWGGRVAVLFDPAGHTVWLSGPSNPE